MAVAAILLKPNAVSRATIEDSDKALMQDAFTLVVRILLDQSGDSGQFAPTLERAALKAFNRIDVSVGDRFEAVGDRLQSLIAPIIDMVTGGEEGWPEDTAEQIEKTLDLIREGAEKIQTLDIGALRGPIRDMVAIIEEELGLTPDFLEELLQGLFKDMADSYTDLAATLEDEARENAQAMAQLLLRLNRKIEGGLALPVLNPDTIATAAMKLLRKFNLEQVMATAQDTIATVGEVLDLFDSVLALVPFTGQGTMSIGSDHAGPPVPERSHCWYLSWLLGDRYAHRPGSSKVVHGLTSIFNPSPADEIWGVNKETDFVRRYLFHREQRFYDSTFRDHEGSDGTYKVFEFDGEAAAVAAAARAGVEAAREAKNKAQVWVDDGSEENKEAFEEAFETAKEIWDNANEFAVAAAERADKAHGQAVQADAEIRDAQAGAEAAKGSVDSAEGLAQSAFSQWQSTGRPEAESGQRQLATAVEKVHRLVDLTSDAATDAAAAKEAARLSHEKAGAAATQVAAAYNTTTLDMPEFAATALTSAQATLTAAESASTAAGTAAEKASQALVAAREALREAYEAKVGGEEAESAAEQAEDALDDAHDVVEDTPAGSVYQAALDAFDNAVDAAEDAADAAEDAADAALLARAAAVAAASNPRYAFKHIRKETMESWAKGTSVGADFLEMLLHAFSAERGNFLTNIIIGVYSLTNAIVKLSADRPIPQWIEWLVRFLGPFLGCFPYMHYNTDGASANRTIFWFTYYGHRVLESHSNHLAAYGLRNVILSILTLVNHDPDAEENRPLNFEAIEGVTLLFTAPFIFLWAALTPHEHYAVEDEWELYWLDWIIGGLCFSLIANTIGFLVGMAIARSWRVGMDGFILWLSQLWKTIIVSLIGYIPAMFLIHENDTDDGNWGFDAVMRPYITGYPPRDSSPYRLPFRGGPIQCAQGNTGFWSHNGRWTNGWQDGTNEVYSYDFANDFDDEITAARDGIVVDFFDWALDNQNNTQNAPGANVLAGQTNSRNWNFICLRHHNHDPVHDPTDFFFNPVHTYKIYGHGSNGSVRQVFNTTDPSLIIGREMSQGDTIILCDDTGRSAYNHLHTQVMVAPPQLFDFVSTNAAGATIGTGDGILLTFTAGTNLQTGFAGTALASQIRRFSVHVLFNGIVTARDNGAGSFQGQNIDTANSTIDYTTGAVTVAWLAGFPPPNTVSISDCHDTVLEIGTGNGATLAFNNNNLTIPAAPPVAARVPLPGTVTVQRNGVNVAQDQGDGTFATTLDEGGGNCTIDYATGVMNITWVDGHAPLGRVDVTAQFEALEQVGTGDARTGPYDLTLPHPPVVADTIVVLLDDQPLVEDDGTGGFIAVIDPSPAASQVTYSPGNLVVTWLADHAPANGVDITAHFETTHLVGTGDGAELVFSAVLPTPMDAGSVRILLDGTQIATEDGSGDFDGATIVTGPGQSRVDHATGQVDVIFQSGQAPASGIDVQAVYRGQQAVGTGTGVQASFNSPLHGDVSGESVTIQLDGIAVAVDDGVGNLNAIIDTTAGVSSMDYATGAMTLAWRNGHVLATGVAINARYESIHTVGIGDNATLSFDSTIPGSNITPESVVVQLNTLEAARDDGAGNFSTFIDPDPAVSNIDYLNGILNIAFQAGHPPDNNIDITLDYDFGEHLGNGAPGTLAFNTTLPNLPARPGGVRILVDWNEHAQDDTNGTIVGIGPGAGTIDGPNSTIDYRNGPVTITWLAGSEPAAGLPVVLIYEPTIVVNENDLSNHTLPFVYRDADHAEMYRAAKDDGVPRSLRYYTSENT